MADQKTNNHSSKTKLKVATLKSYTHELIKNRQLDATLQSAGLGVSSIRDLGSSLPIQMVAVPADIITKIGTPYVAKVIPAGTYDGQTEDVPTAAVIKPPDTACTIAPAAPTPWSDTTPVNLP